MYLDVTVEARPNPAGQTVSGLRIFHTGVASPEHVLPAGGELHGMLAGLLITFFNLNAIRTSHPPTING